MAYDIRYRNDKEGKAIRFNAEKERLKDILSPKEFKRMVDQHIYQDTVSAGKAVFDELTGRTKPCEPYGKKIMSEGNRKFRQGRSRRASING